MNACIFRFYNFYSGTCESALENAEAAIASTEFEHRLRVAMLQILDRVQWEKKPRFAITVTGYARFFNDDTPECDDYSMGVWWQGPKLKREMRQRTSNLVIAVNKKLRATVDSVNALFAQPRAFFVDFDAEFDGHRFCEPGVKEPDYQREDTWFFLVGGADSGQNGTMPNGTFPNATSSAPSGHIQTETLSPLSTLVDPERCLEPARRRGDWGQLAICYMAMAKKRDPTLRPAHDGVLAANSMWYVPTYYGKTFHPRSLGHEVVRDKIYEIWRQHGL